jgi:hypothetical protein
MVKRLAAVVRCGNGRKAFSRQRSQSCELVAVVGNNAFLVLREICDRFPIPDNRPAAMFQVTPPSSPSCDVITLAYDKR